MTPPLNLVSRLAVPLVLASAPLWPGIARAANGLPRRAEVDLRQYGISWEKNNPQILFSPGGESICLWWSFGNLKPVPARFFIYNLHGDLLGRWSDTNFVEHLREFPAIRWRWTRSDFVQERPAIEPTEAEREALAKERPDAFEGLVHTNGSVRRVRVPPTRIFGGVAFNCDLSQGTRISYIRLAHGLLEGVAPVLEMWKLSEPREKLWALQLSSDGESRARGPEPIGLLHDWGNEPLLINLNGQWCTEIDPSNGKMLRRFTFGPIESDEEARQRVRKFRGTEDDSGSFSVASCAYEPTHRWIACGCSVDRRVRVFDIASPEKILFEAYTNANPFRPWGGNWSAGPVEFFAKGRYLAASYEFERRFGPYKHEVEVYETSSWTRVWKTDDNKVQSFTLSPDGQTMAFIRKATLTICPFKEMTAAAVRSKR